MPQRLASTRDNIFSLWAERDTGGTRHPLLFRRCPSFAPPSPRAPSLVTSTPKTQDIFWGEKTFIWRCAQHQMAAKMAAPPAAPSPGAAPARGDRPAPRRPPPSSSAAAAAALGSPCRREAKREGGREGGGEPGSETPLGSVRGGAWAAPYRPAMAPGGARSRAAGCPRSEVKHSGSRLWSLE